MSFCPISTVVIVSFNMLVSLDNLLLYKNIKIIERYNKDFSYKNLLSGEKAFKELLKYLWLSRKLELDKEANPIDMRLDFSCVMHHEMSEVDDMWHTFLLFTKDYMIFCDQYFGKYMHHMPFTETDMIPTEETFCSELKKYLCYTNQHLGEKTLLTWFGQLL